MDTEKLLRILRDFQQEEKILGISGKIKAIQDSVAQNNSEGFEAAKAQLLELVSEMIEKAPTFGYSRTEVLLLKKIGGIKYCGDGLVRSLQSFFSSPSFELVNKLSEYSQERNEFIQKSKQVETALIGIGVQEYRPDAYEMGIVLPSNEGSLDQLQKRIHEMELLLKALAEAAGKSHEHVKITRLSNGTLELFSLQPAEVALLLSSLLLNVGHIWDRILGLKKKEEEVDGDKFSDKTKKKIKAALRDEAEEIKKEILDELPDRIVKEIKNKKIDDGRKNEIRNQIRVSVKAIFGWFEAGIEIDVTPIRLTSEEGEEVPADGKTIEIKKNIEDANNKLKAVYELPPDRRKLPFSLQAPKEEIEKKTETRDSIKSEAKTKETVKKIAKKASKKRVKKAVKKKEE